MEYASDEHMPFLKIGHLIKSVIPAQARNPIKPTHPINSVIPAKAGIHPEP